MQRPVNDPAESRLTRSDRSSATVHQTDLDRELAITRTAQENARSSLDLALAADARDLCDIHYGYMWQLREFVGTLEQMGLITSPVAHRFIVSRLFVERCLAELTFDGDEYMFYVSGAKEGKRSYLSDIVNFEIKTRSVCGVVGEDDSVFKAVMSLQSAGQPLTAWFHSHPGSGPGASHPSTTDRRQQRNLERLGYHSVGAIFFKGRLREIFRRPDEIRSRNPRERSGSN